MLGKVLLLLIWLSVVLCQDFQDPPDDFEDTDLTLMHHRIERGYGNVGGPIAKNNGKNGTSTTTSSPQSQAQSQSQTQSQSSSQKGQSSTTAPSSAIKSGWNGGKDTNGACPLTVYPSSMLVDIVWGAAKPPDYQLIATNSCKILSECGRICRELSCNYFTRYSLNGSSKFYLIKSEKLTSLKLTETRNYDSYIPVNDCDTADSSSTSSSTTATNPNVNNVNVKAEQIDDNKIIQGPAPNPNQKLPGPGVKKLPGNGDPVEVAKQAFKLFMQSHNKTYANSTDEEKYFKEFQKGLEKIKQLNAMKQNPGDAVFGQTKFTDAPFSEFVKKFTGAVKNLNPAGKFDVDVSSILGNLPKKFDWRDEGVVPNIRYQKECGSCYAFSTTDLTAIQWAIDHKENKSYLLAPQYVLDCIHGQAALGCDGGRPYLVLESNANCTGTKNCSWPRETCYSYQNAANKTCKAPNLACAQDQPKIQVQRAYYLDVSGDGKLEKDRLSALLPGGPMVALVSVTDSWQYYTGGIMRATQCKDAGDPNHAVVIIGYNFTDPSSPHYIVRNTWDTDWGEKGHFRIEAGSNACGIAKFLSFACTANCGDGSQKNLLDRATNRLNEKGSKASSGSSSGPKNTALKRDTPAVHGKKSVEDSLKRQS